MSLYRDLQHIRDKQMLNCTLSGDDRNAGTDYIEKMGRYVTDLQIDSIFDYLSAPIWSEFRSTTPLMHGPQKVEIGIFRIRQFSGCGCEKRAHKY